MRTESGASAVASAKPSVVIDEFFGGVVARAQQDGIVFDVLSGVVDEHVDLSRSDVDFLCPSAKDAERLVDLVLARLKGREDISLIALRKATRGSYQIVCAYEGEPFMFDIMDGFSFGNIRLLDGEAFFQLKEVGLDARALAGFIKGHAKSNMRRFHAPERFYSFCVRETSLLQWAVYLAQKVLVSARAMVSPRTGLFVVVLGPDGSGKSTVIDEVHDALSARRSIVPMLRFHWRPQLIDKEELAAVTKPHGKSERGVVMSLVKLAYLLFAFIVGYMARASRILHRGGIVIFDRYYHDMLVDPKRYRYGGPLWLAKLVGKLVPQPDLWIFLDAPATVLHGRKQEVSLDETRRQSEAYRSLVAGFPNRVIVDASQPLLEVVLSVNRAILSFMEQRTKARLRP